MDIYVIICSDRLSVDGRIVQLLKRKWLLNQKVFIFASSSCPEHSTLGDVKSSVRVREGSALASSSRFRLRMVRVTFIR